jgi:3-hydroxybutyryl-CoA dehydrogenase
LDGRVNEVTLIAVAGVGDHGCRLARQAALAGLSVRLYDADASALERAQERIRRDVEVALAAGALSPVDKQRALDGIFATSDLDEAVTHADLVAEADAPSEEARRALLLRIGEACRASALVLTCGGDPDALMDWLPQPGRLVGLRLDAPVASVVSGVESTAEARESVERFVRRVAPEASPG